MVHYHFKQFHAINSFPCLHLSQPAVTAHLRRVEEIVGKPLVSRSTRGVKLTTHGHALRQRAVDGRCHLKRRPPCACFQPIRIGNGSF
jgi:hypothetical protein